MHTFILSGAAPGRELLPILAIFINEYESRLAPKYPCACFGGELSRLLFSELAGKVNKVVAEQMLCRLFSLQDCNVEVVAGSR
jgi:hypothetical protein